MVGLGGIAGSAGCLNAFQLDGGDAPDPIDLSGGKLDYHGGMKIGMHGGPNGQIFYRNNNPELVGGTSTGSETQDDVAWFHTLVHGLFPYHFQRVDQGWEAEVIYVTDYSAIEWEVFERDGNEYMPAPTDPESFADATGLDYVAGSDIMGGMGPELHPFSDSDNASDFTDTHGGRIVSFDDINRRMIRGIQRAGEQ
jgi:nitrous oxide reductase accessory protein NosL